MKDEDKPREQLINELTELRRRLVELEASDAERKRVEGALRVSEKKYRNIFNNLNDVVSTADECGNWTFLSPSVMRILGYEPAEMVGRPAFDFMLPEDVVTTREAHERIVREGGDVWQFENRYIHKDGRIITLAWNVVVLRNEEGRIIGTQGVGRDITERKQAEQALKRNRDYLDKLNNSLLEAILTVRIPERVVEYVNQSVETIFGYEPQECVGQTTEMFYSNREEYLKFGRKLEKTIKHGKNLFETEQLLKRKNGEVFSSETTVTFFREEGKVTQVISVVRDITERKQAEQALQESEQNFRNSLDNSPLGIRIINIKAEGETIYANQAILDIYGYSSIEELKSIPAVERHTPKSYAERQERVRKREAGETVPDRFEQSIIRKNGEVRHLEVFNREVLWGGEQQFQLIYLDVTDRKQAERELLESEKKYKSLINHVKLGVFRSTPEPAGKFLEVNPAMEEITGYRRKELLQMNAADLYVYPEQRGLVLEEVASGKGRAAKEVRFRRKDGTEMVVLDRKVAVKDDAGEILYFDGVMEDITERKEAEEREKQLQKELNLASRLASVGELAAGVAHEINNPLTGILGFSERLLRKSTDKKVSRDLKRIHNETRRAAKVVERLLTFARRREPKKENSDVNHILRKALELRAYELKTGNIEIETDLAPSLPRVMVDFHQIQEVFLNIILNAEQVMVEANHGGKFTIKTQQMKNCIRVSFTDDGPGIPAEHLDRVFDPFFTTREGKGGTGLGLSVCHGIVAGHGGRIYAKSKPGKGATFVVELPATTEE